VAVVLEGAQHVEDDEVPDVEVGCCGIEPELYPERVSPLEPRAKVIFDVDLDCPLSQALEKLPAHTNYVTGLLLKKICGSVGRTG
jgi:hypothetical protein